MVIHIKTFAIVACMVLIWKERFEVASVLKVISVQVDKRGEIVYTGFQQGNRKMIFP